MLSPQIVKAENIDITMSDSINMTYDETGSAYITPLRIINNTKGTPISLKGLSVENLEDYELVSWGSSEKNDKGIALRVNGKNVRYNNEYAMDFFKINPQSSNTLNFTAKDRYFESGFYKDLFKVNLTFEKIIKDVVLTYNSNGGDYVSPVKCRNGDTIQLPEISKGDDNKYILRGWKDDRGIIYRAGTEYTVGAENETLTAVWVKGESILTNGKTFNSLIDKNITSLTFTHTAIPDEYRDTAVVVSLDGYSPSYFYVVDDQGYVSPDKDDIEIKASANSAWMFSELPNVTNIRLDNFTADSITSMTGMFSSDSCLEELDLSMFNGLNVISLESTFDSCSSLRTIDLSNFSTTSKLNNLYKTFINCSSLESLIIPNLNVRGVIKMDYFLKGCSSLMEVDLGGFYTPNLTSAEYSFQGLTSLKSLYLPDLNFSKCSSTRWMFSYCSSLETIDIGQCDFGNIREMRGMFAYDYALRSINLVNFNLRTSANTMEMFREDHKLSGYIKFTYPITPWYGYKYMFENCSTDTEVPLVLKFNDVNALPHIRNMYSTKSANSNIIIDDRPDGTVKMTFDTKCDIVIDPAYIVKGTTANLISPAREGLKFLYWYDDMGNQYQGTITPTGDMVLHAEWEVTGGSVLAKGSTFRSRLDTSIKSMVFTSYKVPSEYKATAKVISDGVSIRSFFYVIDGVGYISPEFDDVQIYSNSDSSFMIYNLASLESVDLGNFDTSKVTTMREMFSILPKLRSIDLSKFNTSNVTDLSGMFFRCSSLESLDLSSFDTSKVTTFESLVYECSSLKELDLSMLDTSKAKNMKYMIIRCTSLEKLNMRGIDTSHVTTFDRFATGCKSLKEVDMTGLDTSACTNMQQMFDACESLEFLDLSSFETSKVVDFSGMFRNCYRLKILNLPVFDFKSINSYWNSYIDVMFQNCQMLNGDLLFKNVRYYPYYSSKVFEGAVTDENSHLTLKYESPDDINLLTRIYNTKSANSNITLDYKPIGYNKVIFNTNSSYSMDPAYALTDTDLMLISPNVEGLEFLYWTDEFGNKYTDKITLNRDIILTANWSVKEGASTTLITGVNINKLLKSMIIDENSIEFTYSKVPDEYKETASIISLDTCSIRAYLYSIGDVVYISPEFEGVQIYASKSCSHMFENLSTVNDIRFDNFDTSMTSEMNYMFSNCSVRELDLNSFDTSKVTYFNGMFNSCSKLEVLFISNFNTSNSIYFDGMFSGCSKLKELDVSNFDTSKGIAFNSMFTNCDELKELDLSNFDVSKGRYLSRMFFSCDNLEDLNSFKLDCSSLYDLDYMFYGCGKLSGDIYIYNLKQTPSYVNYYYIFSFTSIDSINSLNLHYDSFNTYSNLKNLYSTKSADSNIRLDYKPIGTMRIRFDTKCGLSIDPVYVVSGGSLTLINPYMEGLEFVCWVDELGNEYSGDIVVDRDLDLSAKWVVKEDAVTILDTGVNFNNTVRASIINNNVTSLEFTDTVVPDEYKDDTKVVSVTNCIRVFFYNIGTKGYIAPEYEGVSIHANANCMNMFRDLTTIKTFDFRNFYTSDVTSMETMFYNCKSAVSLDTGNFNTSKVTNMSHMFYGCASLTNLDLSNFDTSHVVTLDHTFGGCTNLISADISSFDTSSCENIGGLFRYCENLKSVDLSNFDTSKVKTIGSMFQNCFNLEAFKMCVFDMQSLSTYIDQVFMNCHKLSGDIIFKNLRSLPWYCEKSFLNASTAEGAEFTIHYMDIADLPYVKALYNSRTSDSVKLDYKPYGTMQIQFDTKCGAVVDNMYVKPNTAFELPTPVKEGLTFVKWVDAEGVEFDPSQGIDCDIILNAVWVVNEGAESTLNTGSFINGVLPTTITSLEFTKTAIPAEYKDTATVVSTGNGIRSFYYAIGDQGYISPEFDNVTIYANADCSRMFNYKKLKSIQFENFDTSRVTNMLDMFAYAFSLEDADITGFDTSKVTNMQGMFYQCYELRYLDFSNFDFTSARTIDGLVKEAHKLTGQIFIRSNYASNLIVDTGFYNTAINSEGFTVYYLKEGEDLARRLYNTKSNNSNIKIREYGKIEVSFDTDGVLDLDNIYVEPNTTLKLPIPEYEGVEFLYWEDSNGNHYNSEAQFDSDITLYAKWDLKDEVILNTGTYINTIISNNITSLEFTTSAIPVEYKDSAKLVSKEMSKKAYYYEIGTKGYISPESDNIPIYANEDCYNFFLGKNLSNIDLTNFHTDYVINMYNMFANLKSIEKLDLSGFNTSNVTNMRGMFYGCDRLSDLDISNFVYDNVTTFRGMFWYASSLSGKMVVTGGNTISDFDIQFAFNSSATSSSGFYIYYDSNGEALAKQLYGTKSSNSNIILKDMRVCEISFDTDGLIAVDSITANKGTTVSLPKLEYDNLEFLYWEDAEGNHYTGNIVVNSDIVLKAVWGKASNLVVLKSDFSFKDYLSSNITEFRTLNTVIPDEYKDTAQVVSDTSSRYKIYYYEVGSKSYLQSEIADEKIVLNGNLNDAFSSNTTLELVDLSNLGVANLTSMESMFSGCSSLQTVDLSSLDTTNVTSTKSMFADCTSLQYVDISNFNTPNIVTMGSMFSGCSNLVNVKLGTHNSSALQDVGYMFYNCKMLQDMEIDSLYLNNARIVEGIFKNCYRLSGYWIIHTSSIPYSRASAFFFASGDAVEPFVLYYKEGCYNLAKSLYDEKSSFSNIILSEYKEHEIAFDTGGNGTLDSIYAYPDKYVELPTPKCDGAEFLYWEDDAGNQYTTSIRTDNDITLYAKWKSKEEVRSQIINGTDFNSILGNDIKIISFTSTAIPNKYKPSAKIISLDGNVPIYYYTDGTSAYVSPECDGVTIVANEDCYNMFHAKTNLVSIDFQNFDTSEVKVMYNMFDRLSNIEKLDLRGFDTSNVTNMRGMFYGCNKLSNLDISNFVYDKVTTFRGMFWYDYKLSGKMVITGGTTLPDFDVQYAFFDTATNSSGFHIYYDANGEALAKQLYGTKTSASNIVLECKSIK